MKNQWYCGVEGQQFGPFSWEQMRAMAEEGRIVGDSLVRREIDLQWMHAAQIPGLLKRKSKKPGPTSNSSAGGAASRKRPSAGGSSIHSGLAAPGGSGCGESSTGLRRARLLASKDLAEATSSARQPRTSPPTSTIKSAAVAATATPAPPADSSARYVLGRPGEIAAPPPVPPPAEPPLPALHVERPASKASTSGAHAVPPPRKRLSTVAIVSIAAGVALLVGAMGIGLVAYGVMRSSSLAQEQLATAQKQAEADLARTLSAAEGNPTTAAELAVPAAAPKANASQSATTLIATSTKLPKSGKPSPTAIRLANQATWMPLNRVKGVVVSKLRLQVNRVWLAADASGTVVIPEVPAAASEEATADGDDTAPTGIADDANFVFVELIVENTAPLARSYRSWNGGPAGAVTLANQDNREYPLVPIVRTPGVPRVTKEELASGQTVTDILVFAAPQEPIQKLRLLLGKDRLAEGARGYFAWEIPLESLMEDPAKIGKAQRSATAARDGTEGSLAGEGEPDTVDGLKAAIAASAGEPEGARPTPSEDKPPSKEELDRQFRELEQGPAPTDGAPETKGDMPKAEGAQPADDAEKKEPAPEPAAGATPPKPAAP